MNFVNFYNFNDEQVLLLKKTKQFLKEGINISNEDKAYLKFWKFNFENFLFGKVYALSGFIWIKLWF